jgi:hypothetical protein
MKKTRLIAGVLLLLSTGAATHGPAAIGPQEAGPDKVAGKGERILRDKALFVDSGSRSLLDLVSGLRPFAMSGTLGTAVAGKEAPRLSEIQARHGTAERIEERKGSASLPGPPFGATVHWYGEFGFCVSRSETSSPSAGRVTWILWSR